MVFNPNLTITFGDEEEICAILTLANYDILRQIEQGTDIVDQEVNDIFIPMEYWIALYRIQKDMLCYLKPQAGRNDAQKLIKLPLVIEIALGEHHKLSYTSLK